MGLKTHISHHSQIYQQSTFIDNPQGLFILISVSSSWPIPLSLNVSQIQLLSLIQFEVILNYLSYVHHLSTQCLSNLNHEQSSVETHKLIVKSIINHH